MINNGDYVLYPSTNNIPIDVLLKIHTTPTYVEGGDTLIQIIHESNFYVFTVQLIFSMNHNKWLNEIELIAIGPI